MTKKELTRLEKKVRKAGNDWISNGGPWMAYENAYKEWENAKKEYYKQKGWEL